MNSDENGENDELMDGNSDEIWKRIWDIFVDKLLTSEELLNEIKLEQMALAHGLNHIDEIFEKEEGKSVEKKKKPGGGLPNFLLSDY